MIGRMKDPFVALVEKTEREIVGMIALQERIEKRKLDAQKALNRMNDTGADIGSPRQAGTGPVQKFENRSLPDEIKHLLRASYPEPMTPRILRLHLDQLAWDFGGGSNPQSAIHMALKRMVESSPDVVEECITPSGKKGYRCAPISHKLSDAFSVPLSVAGREANRLLEQMLSEVKK